MPALVASHRTPKHWRRSAVEAKAIADAMTDPDAKAAMLDVAESYHHLARSGTPRQRAELGTGP